MARGVVFLPYLHRAIIGGTQMIERKESAGEAPASTGRRDALRRLGRFAAVTAPTVTLLIAAKSKPASAQGTSVR